MSVLFFICLFVSVSGRPIDIDLSPIEDEFLAWSCHEEPFLKTVSPLCQAYMDGLISNTANPSNFTISIVPKLPKIVAKTAHVAGWLKAIIGIISSLITIWTAVAAFLKYFKGKGLLESISFGLLRGQEGKVKIDHSKPIELDVIAVHWFYITLFYYLVFILCTHLLKIKTTQLF